jgi:hypothetical protein
MGRLFSIVTRAAGLVVMVCLAGCGGLFQGTADLGKATPAVQPIEVGTYVDQKANPTQIELTEDGGYRLTNENAEELLVHIFGPVGGLYVAQLVPEADKQGLFGYAIIRIDAEGIHLADEATGLMGEMLFGRLGVPAPRDGADVNSLTDNPALNWALLQEFIVTYRSQLVFQRLYSPARP